MAYCTQDDLLKLIPAAELTQLTTESGDTPDAAVVSEAIAKADAEIDAYCGKAYQVPFSPVPEMVRSLSTNMAIYLLVSRRNLGQKIYEPWRQKYEDAVAFLKNVAKGLATLGETADPPASMPDTVTEVSSQERVFSRTTMGDF